jgi:hypothetical protein
MAKLHSYYVTNASTEMSYAHTSLTDSEFYKAISESFAEIAEFSDDEIKEQENELDILEYDDDDRDLFENNENNKEIPEVNNEIIMENYFNFDDEDLQKALALEVKVVIEQEVTNYDHGENDFDINALLDANFNKVNRSQNEK